MAQELAAVYAGVSALAMDVCLLEYVDPTTLDAEKLRRTLDRFGQLQRQLLPTLRDQNLYETCGLSLELQHLMENVGTSLERLIRCLDLRLSPSDHFRALHLQGTCDRHQTIEFGFYGAWHIDIKLSLINDIEIFFKRLNSVFYCLGAGAALEGLGEVLTFLGRLRGISPVPKPDLYVSNLPCIECLQEASLMPNQGESLPALLTETSCEHICRPLCPEPVRGLFENELTQIGVQPFSPRPDLPIGESNQEDFLTANSLAAMGKHHIFSEVTGTLLELSNLIYWRSGEEKSASGSNRTCSHMTMLLSHEAEMHSRRSELSYLNGRKDPPCHFFDCFQPKALESLFCGGLFNSIEDTIDGLKNDCSSAFYQRVNYTATLQRQNEFYVRLSRLLATDHASSDQLPTSQGIINHNQQPPGRGNPEQVLNDARHRKEQYLQKVTRDGFKKLSDCLKNQSHILSETLRLRLWGSTIYSEAATLLNHFLSRSRFTAKPWQDHTGGGSCLFENSKYMKNSLYGQRLGGEHVEILTLQFYGLITGPLSKRHTMFPNPPNVNLAQCFEAAGMLPHQKLMVSEMIWPSIEPKDWMDTNFNAFYDFRDQDLNTTQKRAWEFLRELVLSVSLYNRTWEKDLRIFVTESDSLGEAKPTGPMPGLYVTYETDKPLVLIGKKDGWIFKDLYALLYHHLQLCDHNVPRLGMDQTPPSVPSTVCVVSHTRSVNPGT
ncbi:DNA packaging terminase subunit 2 [Colobine gammaherpesvirus 1]|uniref:DNA packaging terminase subunit 2 n=1 Tax=Colobine gammaherpesvirus 1 TaxID=2597325 RepID=A0A5B8G7V2_9GAMA|nr:DNA packaging terminase subunit 2 [Colobine gammaherpesvirus 1]QDQ69214.1 DNA packaging terminase subunit 2 [Colobine gammaherpesvirus 1]